MCFKFYVQFLIYNFFCFPVFKAGWYFVPFLLFTLFILLL